jgi:starvation-inducible DNA-binding protein
MRPLQFQLARKEAAMHPTRNDLPARNRARLEKLLNQRLADALDLEAASKQAHWNVKGPNFIALHELFDKLHDNIEEHVDSLAERITAIGGTALGTVGAAARGSSLAPYPESISSGPAHVAALADRLADFGRKVRQAIATAAKLDDADSADLFTEISRDVDKYLWFLEAHLHEQG